MYQELQQRRDIEHIVQEHVNKHDTTTDKDSLQLHCERIEEEHRHDKCDHDGNATSAGSHLQIHSAPLTVDVRLSTCSRLVGDAKTQPKFHEDRCQHKAQRQSHEKRQELCLRNHKMHGLLRPVYPVPGIAKTGKNITCLLYTSPSPRD